MTGVEIEAAELAHTPPFRIGRVSVEPARGTIRADDGREVTLQPQVMRVLLALVAADPATLSREDLRQRCWAGRTVGDDAIDRTIARIRKADAELDAGLDLATIPKVGYRLDAARSPDAGGPSPDVIGPTPSASATRRGAMALAGGALLAAGGGAWWWTSRGDTGRSGPLRIAVPPIVARTGDGASKAFADALTQELRGSLARIDGVAIVTASGGGTAPTGDYIVSGTVDRAGPLVRAAMSLRSVTGSAVRIGFTRTAAPSARFALQDDITGEMIEDVAGLVGPERVGEPLPGYQRDAVAVRRVLEAEALLERTRSFLMNGGPDAAAHAADAASRRIDEALAIDTNDPGALVAQAALIKNGWSRALAALPRTAMQRLDAARVPLRRALRTDPNFPPALAALADIRRRYEWRWGEAENLVRRALAKQPDLVEGRWTYAYMLGTQGRCVEGLRQARMLAVLAPGSAWRRIAIPRLLYLTGARDETFRRYDRELAAAPGNAFVMREIYFVHLSEGDARALVALADRVAALWRGRTMPEAIARLAQRARAAAAAIDGDTSAFHAMIAADLAAYDAPRTGPSATLQGRASIDLLFVYAMEMAHAGATDAAIGLLDRALAARSLYWPASLPYGPAEFPAAVRKDPRYVALWKRDERLAALIDMRRRAVMTGQTAGIKPDGTRVRQVAT